MFVWFEKKRGVIIARISGVPGLLAMADIMDIVETEYRGTIKRINMGLPQIAREAYLGDIRILLSFEIIGENTCLRVSPVGFIQWLSVQKRKLANELVERLVKQLQVYWRDGRGEVNRPVLTAILRGDGWTTCPFCKINFSTRNKLSFSENRHIRCGTTLNLITKDS